MQYKVSHGRFKVDIKFKEAVLDLQELKIQNGFKKFISHFQFKNWTNELVGIGISIAGVVKARIPVSYFLAWRNFLNGSANLEIQLWIGLTLDCFKHNFMDDFNLVI